MVECNDIINNIIAKMQLIVQLQSKLELSEFAFIVCFNGI